MLLCCLLLFRALSLLTEIINTVLFMACQMSQYAYAILTSRVDGLMVHIVLYHKIMN